MMHLGSAIRHKHLISQAVQPDWPNEGVGVFNRDHWPAVKRLFHDPELWRLGASPAQI